jgi:hypothetical protein
MFATESDRDKYRHAELRDKTQKTKKGSEGVEHVVRAHASKQISGPATCCTQYVPALNHLTGFPTSSGISFQPSFPFESCRPSKCFMTC